MKHLAVTAGLWLTLAGIAAEPAHAGRPDVDGMKTWTLPDFTLYSPDASTAATVVGQIEPIQRAISTFMGKKVESTGLPTHVYIATSSVWHDYLRPSVNITAEYVPARFAHYILLSPYHTGLEARLTLNHEYAHYFLRTQYQGAIPVWFDEGFAELVEPTQLRAKLFEIGMPLPKADTPWVAIDRLLRIDKQSPEYLSRSTRTFHYRAWTFVHKGLIADREFGTKIFRYLDAINDGVPIDDAVVSCFGMSPAELDELLQRYGNQSSYRTGKYAFEQLPKARLAKGRKASDQESLEFLASMMLDTGLNPGSVKEVIEAARAGSADSARLRVLSLRLAARDGTDADVEKAWQQVDAQTTDAAIARGAGVAMFSRIQPRIMGDGPAEPGVSVLARRALDLLRRSERALPADAEAAWALGLLSAWLNDDTAFAQERVTLAMAAVPRNADLAMASALIHAKTGNRKLLLEQLHNTGKWARTVELRLWAAQNIAAVEKGGRP